MAYYSGQDLRETSEADWKAAAVAQMRRRQKPIWQLWGLAKAIQDIDADILMLVEVGGEESLQLFNHHFLNDRYIPHFLAGNARRGIDLGYLVRRGLPFRAEAKSNRDLEVEVSTWTGKVTSRFSRDVAELRLAQEGSLRLILLLTHLKSKITSDGDFQGKDVRTAEAMALAHLYSRRREEFPSVPIIVGGDFNAELGSLELEPLNWTDLTDLHDLLGTLPDDRVSLVHFDFAGRAHFNVLDYLLLSPQLKQRVVPQCSGVYRYKGFYDLPEALPTTRKERFQMPSDHYPVVATVRI